MIITPTKGESRSPLLDLSDSPELPILKNLIIITNHYSAADLIFTEHK